MSETVLETGKLKIITSGTYSIEVECLKILGDSMNHLIYDTASEMINSERDQEYIVIKDILYSVHDYKNHDCYDYCGSSHNPDGTINFTLSYHNGGCSFVDALEEALSDE